MNIHRIHNKKEKERKIREAREQYRIDLQNARKKFGDWIPFGYNLDLLNEKLNDKN